MYGHNPISCMLKTLQDYLPLLAIHGIDKWYPSEIYKYYKHISICQHLMICFTFILMYFYDLKCK